MKVKILIPIALFFLYPVAAEGFKDQGFIHPHIKTEFTHAPYIDSCIYTYEASPSIDPCKHTGTDHRDLNIYEFKSPYYKKNSWVLTANYEAAYRDDVPGIPGQSFPVKAPQPRWNPFEFLPDKTSTNSYRAHLIVDSNNYNGIPFLGIGAFSKKTGETRLGRVDRDSYGYYDSLKFNAKLFFSQVRNQQGIVVSNPETNTSELQLQLFAEWGGEIRMIIVHLIYGSFYEDKPFASRNWNWPIEDSVFYPGANIAYVTGEFLQKQCNFSSSELPYYEIGKRNLSLQKTPVSLDYNINLSKLYKCVSDMGGFSTSMPYQSNLIGVMWAAESGSSTNSSGEVNSNTLWVSVEGMRLNY